MRLTQQQAIDRRTTLRKQRATRQERAMHDTDDYNEAFKAFAKNRDDDNTDDAIASGRVLE